LPAVIKNREVLDLEMFSDINVPYLYRMIQGKRCYVEVILYEGKTKSHLTIPPRINPPKQTSPDTPEKTAERK